jgi:hypothetical protein
VSIEVRRVVPERSFETRVDGDLQGPARLEVEPAGDGSRARLVWELAMARPFLQAAARVARPLLQWGHDWCVDTGVTQFRRRALDGR